MWLKYPFKLLKALLAFGRYESYSDVVYSMQRGKYESGLCIQSLNVIKNIYICIYIYLSLTTGFPKLLLKAIFTMCVSRIQGA